MRDGQSSLWPLVSHPSFFFKHAFLCILSTGLSLSDACDHALTLRCLFLAPLCSYFCVCYRGNFPSEWSPPWREEKSILCALFFLLGRGMCPHPSLTDE